MNNCKYLTTARYFIEDVDILMFGCNNPKKIRNRQNVLISNMDICRMCKHYENDVGFEPRKNF